MSTPIKDSEGVVIGVAQAINRINSKDEPFNSHDERVRIYQKGGWGLLNC